jgi:hypothetical protein
MKKEKPSVSEGSFEGYQEPAEERGRKETETHVFVAILDERISSRFAFQQAGFVEKIVELGHFAKL